MSAFGGEADIALMSSSCSSFTAVASWLRRTSRCLVDVSFRLSRGSCRGSMVLSGLLSPKFRRFLATFRRPRPPPFVGRSVIHRWVGLFGQLKHECPLYPQKRTLVEGVVMSVCAKSGHM